MQEVAQACGIEAMPTFQFFMAGQKLTELRGADPRALDAYVTQLSELGIESVPNALRQFGIDFENGFNADDIDAVMEHFADDGVFVTHDGQRIEGKEAIRAEFAPMLDASSPAVRFPVEDAIADSSNGKVTVMWVCAMEGPEGKPGKEWRGLDVLTVKEEVEGEATVTTDGFFSLNSGCIVLGVLWLLAMRGPLQELQALPSSAWVVSHVKAEKKAK